MGKRPDLKKNDIAIFSLSFLYLFCLSLLQYSTLQIEWHDSGLILYALATPDSVGHLWSYEYNLPFLAEHQSFLLEILSLFFKFIPYLEVWLFFQCLVIAGGVALINRYIDSILNDTVISGIISIAFLLNPYVTHSHLYPHFEILWIPLLSAFLIFSQKGDRNAAIVFLILSLSVKEDGWIYGLACCWISFGRTPKKDLLIYILIILFYSLAVLFIAVPYFFPDRVPHFASKWGKTQGELFSDMALHPISYLRLLISGQSKYLLLSVFGLPLLSTWRILPALGVSLLWMSSVSLDRAFLSFYFGLPSILLYYFTVPFAVLSLSRISERFGWSPKSLRLVGSGLLVTSVGLLFFPGDYSSRGPSLPKVLERSQNWKSSYETVKELRRIRTSCDEKIFASFAFGAYLFCGNDLRLPYRDWESVLSGNWKPDTVVLQADSEEILPGSSPLKDMQKYFDANPDYKRKLNKNNIILWKRNKL
ncbi:DUF2079 domain-containing protein [Leptospira wolffii]|nr:DUF2079 domain-containing protein [Leptospira wolffii]TGK65569.1 DUF2079 domain-containing protein [Leptospira wolffii]TGK74021.1 DUF2079 domain-containing protein [Leptospira wolffii]TGL28880.1 DUF2079 domain-containing protein [Leptospira wolffii]